MDDDFIKEKLNMIAKDDEILEVPAPESLKALNKEFAQKFAKAQENKQKVRRKYLILVVSSCAAAILICVALLCFSYFYKLDDETRYSSERNYIEEAVTYEQIISENNILFYGNQYRVLKSYVIKTEDTNKKMFASVLLQLLDGELNISILLDSEYEYPDVIIYENLREKASTDLFEYSYYISSEDKIAFATFEYNNYTYYFRYSSAYPEDITIIMNSMRA